MIENSTLKVGGNSLMVSFGRFLSGIGNYFSSKGDRIISKNKVRLVTNPSARLFNPFTLAISFTVDNVHKYQIIIQGDYKEKYKESEDGILNITEEEMFLIINSSTSVWFKKE
jgi:hypothetical protein